MTLQEVIDDLKKQRKEVDDELNLYEYNVYDEVVSELNTTSMVLDEVIKMLEEVEV